jgi:hypothetical protein
MADSTPVAQVFQFLGACLVGYVASWAVLAVVADSARRYRLEPTRDRVLFMIQAANRLKVPTDGRNVWRVLYDPVYQIMWMLWLEGAIELNWKLEARLAAPEGDRWLDDLLDAAAFVDRCLFPRVR